MLAKFQRHKFVNGRAHLSDDEFVTRLGVRPDLNHFIVASREAVARMCHVPATFLYPEDSPFSLAKLTTFDWDDTGVVLELEQILGFAIGDKLPSFLPRRFFWYGKPGPHIFGEWCVQVAEYLRQRQSEIHNGALSAPPCR